MGIHDLKKFMEALGYQQYNQKVYVLPPNSVLGIDACNYIHRHGSVIAATIAKREDPMVTNFDSVPKDELIKQICDRIIDFTITLFRFKIFPVWVWDAYVEPETRKPSKFKKIPKLQATRLLDVRDTIEIFKYIRNCGISYLVAEDEADRIGAIMARDGGQFAAFYSVDTDPIIHGAKLTFKEYTYDKLANVIYFTGTSYVEFVQYIADTIAKDVFAYIQNTRMINYSNKSNEFCQNMSLDIPPMRVLVILVAQTLGNDIVARERGNGPVTTAKRVQNGDLYNTQLLDIMIAYYNYRPDYSIPIVPYDIAKMSHAHDNGEQRLQTLITYMLTRTETTNRTRDI